MELRPVAMLQSLVPIQYDDIRVNTIVSSWINYIVLMKFDCIFSISRQIARVRPTPQICVIIRRVCLRRNYGH